MSAKFSQLQGQSIALHWQILDNSCSVSMVEQVHKEKKKKQCEDGWSQQAMFRGLLSHFGLLSDLLKIYPSFLRQDQAPMLKWLSDSDTLTPVRR